MAKVLDTPNLLQSIKRRAMFPANQNTFTDADLLEIATEEMCISVVPKVLQLHEDHYVTDLELPLVSLKSNYEIPPRSIGNKFQDMFYVDTGGTYYETTKVATEDIPSVDNTMYLNGQVATYTIQANEIIFFPNIGPSPTGSILFKYYLSPNELVESERAGVITNIDTTTGIITVADIPDHFSVDIQFDLVMAKSPFKIITLDLTASSIDTNSMTITFDPDDLPDSLAVGDYVMKSGESIVPQLPVELHALLAQRVAIVCLEAQGDTEALKNARIRLKEMEESLGIIIDNRSEGSPTKAVNSSSFFQRW